MASKAVVPQPTRGGAKLKNGQPEERNHRRVLGDIGNLVAAAPAVDGRKPQTKITRPITRGYRAQLLANAEKIHKKPLGEVANGVLVGKGGGAPANKAAVQKKESDEPKAVEAIVISPDEEVKFNKENPIIISGRKSRAGSPRKALTSVLTARSKAACGLTAKPKDPIENIDAADVHDELAVVEYVEDMYKFYKLTEDEGRVHDYMDSQPDLNSKMRTILMDWLIEVHRKFELVPESLYLTVNIVDRFLSMKVVPRRELQLVGISSMLIACKYEEIWAPEVSDFITISDNAYVREQVLLMEKAILGKLEWYLTVPTPYVFLVRYIKASSPSNQEMENMVFFLAELGLVHYPTIIQYCPSMLAAAAVYAARCTLNKTTPLWTKTLQYHTGYSEDQLMDCAKLLVSFHSAASETKLRAVYRKFSNPERGSVALFSPATSLLAATSLDCSGF